jgi:hypothetical protein
MDQSVINGEDELMQGLIKHERSHIAITQKWESLLKNKKHKIEGILVFCSNGDIEKSFEAELDAKIEPMFQASILKWKKENNRLDDAFHTPRSFPEAGI